MTSLTRLLPVVLGSGNYIPPWSSDEFPGSSIDPAKWNVRNAGWDPEYHLPANVTVADGICTITANEEEYGGLHFTSGHINTWGKASWTHVYIEVRAKTSNGHWPAVFMMPASMPYESWNSDPDREDGEIDIYEAWSWTDFNMSRGALCYGAPIVADISSYTLPSGNFWDDYHRFALLWTPEVIYWYVDDVLFKTETSWYSSEHAWPGPFDHPFFLVIHLSVNQSGTFPAYMLLDWVRINSTWYYFIVGNAQVGASRVK